MQRVGERPPAQRFIHAEFTRASPPRHPDRLRRSGDATMGREEGTVTRTLAHVSDLHLGRDARTDAATASLVRALLEADVDEVLLTGDVTHRGRAAELATFERLFAPLRDRLVVVPGNHDRMGDDVAGLLMPGARVQAEERRGLLVVRLDSTAPHNRLA